MLKRWSPGEPTLERPCALGAPYGAVARNLFDMMLPSPRDAAVSRREAFALDY
jgi:hypothetical protein